MPKEPCNGTFRHEIDTLDEDGRWGPAGTLETFCVECGSLITRSFGVLEEGLLISREHEFAHNAGLGYEEYLGIKGNDSYSFEEYQPIRQRIEEAEARGYVDPLAEGYKSWMKSLGKGESG